MFNPCPLAYDELRAVLVLPECLDGVRVMFLPQLPRMSDSAMQWLAEVGCGKNLTSLHLECASFCLSLSVILAPFLPLPLLSLA